MKGLGLIFILFNLTSCLIGKSDINNRFAPFFIKFSQPETVNKDNQESYIISGLCNEQGENINLLILDADGSSLSMKNKITCEENGGWYTEVDMSTMEEGELVITATLVDAQGVTHKEEMKIIKDTSPLLLTINESNILIDTASEYLLDGTCSEEGRPVTLELIDEDSSKLTPQEAISCKDGSWRTTLNTSSLKDGNINISAVHRDSRDEPFYLDVRIKKNTTLPSLEINTPVNIIADRERNYPISGTCSDERQLIRLTMKNTSGLPNETTPYAQPRCQDGSWSARFSTVRLQDGDVMLKAVHEDLAGNTSERTAMIEKDVIKPNIKINTPNNIFLSTAGEYDLSGTCSEEGKSVSIQFTESTPGSNSLSTSQMCSQNIWSLDNFNVASLNEGEVLITVVQLDNFGNRTEINTRVQKSNANLSVTINNASNINDSNKMNYSLVGGCSPDGGRLTPRVENIDPLNTPSCSNGNWSANFNLEYLEDSSSVSITVDYQDQEGVQNAPQARTTIVKDIISPQVSIDDLVGINKINDSAYQLSGDCSDHQQNINININDGTMQINAYCTNNRWSKTINVESILDSTLSFKVTHSDLAGNSSFQTKQTNRSNNVIITVDNPRNITESNELSYEMSGICSEKGSEVTVTIMSISPSPQPTCTNSFTWSFDSLNVSSLSEGNVSVSIVHGGTTLTETIYKGCISLGERGTQTDPIIICNYNNLKGINNNRGKYYILGKNIDAGASWSENLTPTLCDAFDGSTVSMANPCTGMQPIGMFRGGLDGNDYKISNLYIYASQEGVGLFQETTEYAEIKNLKLRNVRVINTLTEIDFPSTGGLVGSSGAKTVVDNCSVTGVIQGNNDTGGLIGSSSGKINNSFSTATVLGKYAGGLVGYIDGGTIISSYARGVITGIGTEDRVGGLVGLLDGSSIINNSFTEAIINGTYYLGGIAGSLGASKLKKSYSLSVVSNVSSGALLGNLDEPTDTSSYELSNIYWNSTLEIQVNAVANEINLLTTNGLSTTNMQISCSPGSSSAICSLGDGFYFEDGSYPKVKKCLDCSPSNPIYSTELVPGQN